MNMCDLIHMASSDGLRTMGEKIKKKRSKELPHRDIGFSDFVHRPDFS
jgi:hypothetical protein